VETKVASHPVLARKAGLEYRNPAQSWSTNPFEQAMNESAHRMRRPSSYESLD
jgi:hypothetical protein